MEFSHIHSHPRSRAYTLNGIIVEIMPLGEDVRWTSAAKHPATVFAYMSLDSYTKL